MNGQFYQSLKSIASLGAVQRPLIIGFLLFGLWRALKRAKLSGRTRLVGWWSVVIPLVVWLSVVWVLALNGVLQPLANASPLLAAATLILPSAVIVFTALLLLTRSPVIGAAADSAPLSWLIGIQVYRVLGFVFLRLWSGGFLPGFFALPAGIGDMLVGTLALPIAAAVRSNSPRARILAYVWNFVGIADLINAIGLGVTSAVVHPLSQAQGTSLVGTSPLLMYPLIMVPAYGVPLAFVLHGLSIWQLHRRGRRSSITFVPTEDNVMKMGIGIQRPRRPVWSCTGPLAMIFWSGW
jgi:hypothetical protein